jgi:RNA polymerase sigma-70 factor (ECF subfamily)
MARAPHGRQGRRCGKTTGGVMREPSPANHVGTAMDASSFPELLRRHAGLIHRVARVYCRDEADRDDVVQEIAVQLWRSRGRYDRRFRETTWIYRIALNVAISFQRRERRHRERRLADDEPEASLIAIAAPQASEPSADVECLLGCIDALGPLDKALVLLYLDGNDHASIAEVLGISVSNVGTKLHRIKERLRAAFEDRARSRGSSHGPAHEKETHAAR